LKELFVDYADLDIFLHNDETGAEEDEEKSNNVVQALHKILRPKPCENLKQCGELEFAIVCCPVCFLPLICYLWRSREQRNRSTSALG
jgi:hypothetical protein